jgi:hypothetical protein
MTTCKECDVFPCMLRMPMDFAAHGMCNGPNSRICTTCKYEPNWSDWEQVTGGLKAKLGECKIKKSVLCNKIFAPLLMGENGEIWEDGYLSIIQCDQWVKKLIEREPHGN